MDTKVEEKPIVKDQVSNESSKQTVPAPIPEKSAWKVEATEKTTEKIQISGGNNRKSMFGRTLFLILFFFLDWPAPQDAVAEGTTNEAEKEKVVKVKSKGQWKPLTPTLVHKSPRRKSRRSKPAADAKKNSSSKATKAAEAPADDKKSKPRSTRPKSSFRRKNNGYISIDADTLKLYIMQQM